MSGIKLTRLRSKRWVASLNASYRPAKCILWRKLKTGISTTKREKRRTSTRLDATFFHINKFGSESLASFEQKFCKIVEYNFLIISFQQRVTVLLDNQPGLTILTQWKKVFYAHLYIGQIQHTWSSTLLFPSLSFTMDKIIKRTKEHTLFPTSKPRNIILNHSCNSE